MQTVLDCGCWLLGDGKLIRFWKDKRLSTPIVDLMQIPTSLHKSLQALVKDLMVDKTWCIPSELAAKFPAIAEEMNQITIPIFPSEDRLIW